MDNIQEIWKDIPLFNGYSASSEGRFRLGAEVLNQYQLTSGYLQVNIGGHTLFSHRVIATVFHKNPLNKTCVHHINNIKWDNRADNLQWVTRSENVRHFISNRGCNITRVSVGVSQFDLSGNLIGTYTSMREASRVTGVQVQRISEVARGKFKQAKGYVWKIYTP